ncbi:thioesterase family protein [Kibdelosporangium lantanae]|uniref:Thioesterase family protein n=1 Tax=Kibdelosporangium lantanae TaxID=1497396 RepID=A0ABW3M7U4_9PSEU
MTIVPEEWLDYNGHVSEFRYLQAFGDNSDTLFRRVGIDETYRAGGHSLYTVETHMHNLREITQGAHLTFTLQILDLDVKRLHIFHTMYADGHEVATAEQMLIHVDMARGKATPMPDWLYDRLTAIHREDQELPRPDRVGRVIGIRR